MTEPGTNLHLIKLLKQLNTISEVCHTSINISEIKGQQESRIIIEELENSFVNLSKKYKAENLINFEQHHALLEGLLLVTYDYHKIATRQSFGEFEQPRNLSKTYVKEDNLIFLEEKSTIISANKPRRARFRDGGRLVICKNTIPDVAQLEIVAADFYRQMLDGRTAQGKVTVDDDGNITGMYTEAIPGFISMLELIEFAKHPYPYVEIVEKINSIRLKIIQLKEQINSVDNIAIRGHLKTELKEKRNLLGAYKSIKDNHLIDPSSHTVNLGKLSDVMAKALCSAFFYQDWDRHKENFGISFKDGSLGVASLDYDKSLTGIFGQDKKAYNWEITPSFLHNFPEFECWYWPTSSNRFRKMFVSLVDKQKIRKMYSEREAAQYLKLKTDKEFQKHAQREWLKLIFIPKELRERSVAMLASDDCDQRLKDTPNILEKRRQELLYSLVRVNNFRENFKDPVLLESVKMELESNLSSEEIKIVQDNWESISLEINSKIALIEAREDKVNSIGLHQLSVAVAASGVSYSLSISDNDFIDILSEINVSQTSKELSRMLNDKLGLNITEDGARKIKEELYLKQITAQVDGLDKLIKSELLENISIHYKHSWMRNSTAKKIKSFKKFVNDYIDTGDLKYFKKATESLRNLGINKKIISNEKFKELVDKQKFAENSKSISLDY